MQKVITLIARKPGTTREAFKDYYEQNHAPLGTRYFPFDKYVRNHLSASVPDDVGFDVYMECWLDQEKAYAILTGEIVQIFDEDEARFMNAPPRPAGVDSNERLVLGPARGVDPRGTSKIAFMVSNTAGGDLKAFYDRVADWGRRLGADSGATRVTLDEIIPGHDAPLFKSDAVLHLWIGHRVEIKTEPPAGVRIDAVLMLDSQETPLEDLKANFGKH